MSRLGPLLVVFFASSLALWVVLSLYVVLNRLIYDVRRRTLRQAQAELGDPALSGRPPFERSRRVEGILARLSKRAVHRVVADVSLPGFLSETFAAYAVTKWGIDRVLRHASRPTGRFLKWRRLAALSVLAQLRHRRVHDLLAAAARERDPDVAGASVVLLGRLRDRRAASILIDLLREQNVSASRVATQLENFPQETAALLMPLLGDALPHVRTWAAYLLSRFPSTPGLGASLASLCHDAEPGVRKSAVQTLGTVGGPLAGRAAAELLDDSVPYVRAHAARALGSLLGVEHVGRIAPLLADRDFWVRLAVKETLATMGTRARHAVIEQLDSTDGFARNGAAEVLQNMGVLDELIAQSARTADEGSLDVLEKALRAGGQGIFDTAMARTDRDAIAGERSVLSRLAARPTAEA